MMKLAFSIGGFIVGLISSYYFQGEAVRQKLTLGSYLGNLPELVGDYPGDFLPAILFACAIFTVGGWFLGRQLDKKIETAPNPGGPDVV